MSESLEFLHASDVKREWVEVIEDATRPLAESHQVEYIAWYHNEPLWFVGGVQLGLVKGASLNILEIHKGDENHLALQIEKLGKETLSSVVDCMLTAI